MYLTCQTVEERCGLAECPQTALLSGESAYQLNTQVNLPKCVHHHCRMCSRNAASRNSQHVRALVKECRAK